MGFLIVCFCWGTATCAQGTVLPLWNPAYQTVDRMEILSGLQPALHTGLRYFQRGDLVRYAIRLDTSDYQLTELDKADLRYIFRDNNEWLLQWEQALALTEPDEGRYMDYQRSPYWEESRRPFLSYFYQTPANFLEVNRPDFLLRLNPMLNLKYGNQQNTTEPYFFNQRGVELRGSIDERIHFYSNIVESQARFSEQVQRFVSRFRALPRNGFYKTNFSSELFNFQRGVDFLNSQAYLAFNLTDHVGAQFGYGKHFLGNGYRSVLLSDFSNNYLYLKLNWRIWKFHLQNIFAEVNSTSARGAGSNQLVPKKYIAAHYLSIRPTPNLEIGLFEAVVFSRKAQFELQYLNPIIFYRTIEQAVGSPDNVLLGFNAKWNIARRFQLYGQFILDEFKFDELILNNEGWWANKYALQLGLKYPNAGGIDHLDLQFEYNTARPYTYTHSDSTSNYSHYGLPLAHPLGANFREWLVLATYQPHPRWRLDARYIQTNYGEDAPNAYYGRNWNQSYNSRLNDYGNFTGQGIATDVQLLGLDLSYQFRHNVFLELHYFRRYQRDANELLDQYFSTGLRMNMGRFRADF